MESALASEIDAATLHERLQQQSIAVMDVRSPAEFAVGHIPGAVSNPVLALDLQAVPIDRFVVVYCGSSGRSGQAAEKLQAAGFRHVSVLKGGLAAWRQAGFATEGR
jgi:rhodanese-related sulfurtransferase